MIVLRCKEHPKYKALIKPKVACFGCWYLWRVGEAVKQGKITNIERVRRKIK